MVSVATLPKANPAVQPVGADGFPADWETLTMEELFAFSGGYSASRADLADTGIAYLHYGDIHVSTRWWVDTEQDKGVLPLLPISLADAPRRSLLNDGDVVFVDASEDEEGASRYWVVSNPNAVPFLSGLHTIVAKPRNNALCNAYKRYAFQHPAVKAQFGKLAVGTKVMGVNKTTIKQIRVPVPPLKEQQTIAEALSDADALIEGLESLIAKKRAIKQGAMQELLTGRRRLAGFNGDWEEIALGSLGSWVGGGTPSMAREDYWLNGTVPWVSSADIRLGAVSGYLRLITERAIAETSTRLVPKGAIGIVTRSGILRRFLPVCVFEEPTAINQDIKALIPSKPSVSGFVAHAIIHQNEAILASCLKTGTTVESIELGWLKRFSILLPPTNEELRAVCKVLDNMNEEFEALTQRLAKTRQIKQGMMQELLTGRVRLV